MLKVSDVFGVALGKTDGEWEIEGDQTLLNLERRVHQEYRWSRDLPLRIEAQYYSGPLFCDPAPEGWIVGNFDYLEIHTPLQYLRNGVIDAWMGCYPDVPDDDDAELISFPLTRLPVHLVVGEKHPLLESTDRVTLEMVKQFPTLAMPDGAYPKVQQVVKDLGLWMLTQDFDRYSKWQRKALNPSDLVVGYATAFTLSFFPSPQHILPLQIPLEVGDSLVVRRDYATHPRLLQLVEKLRTRAAELAQQYPEVSVSPS